VFVNINIIMPIPGLPQNINPGPAGPGLGPAGPQSLPNLGGGIPGGAPPPGGGGLSLTPPVQTSGPLPVPGQPSGAGKLATPEQMQQLKTLLEQIKGKMAENETGRFASDNTVDAGRQDAIREMFGLLQEAGVDLTDPASVGQFLEEMRQADPELAQTFEQTLSDLLGVEGGLGEGEGAPPVDAGPAPLLPNEATLNEIPNNEISNETISQDVPGPLPPGPPGSELG